jgi:ATP-dependent helicase HrpA
LHLSDEIVLYSCRSTLGNPIFTMPAAKKPSKKQIREPWPTPINFPAELPISQRREEIATAIINHQVVILAGETGSGKTTQLPKICLSLGYGERGLIGHTQPRRIAARTVADRIASELKTPLGEGVGYQVRFTDNSSKNTRIKLMTDGVLLAEFQRDRLLKKYDVIIIDEAHERSLNIDFLLGLLKPLCKKRPELKVIITSATIDLDKFSKHFTLRGNAAPIIEVSGRTYPVKTLYQEPSKEDPNLPELITETVEQVIRGEAKGEYNTSGDILVFCAGEREIRDAAQALRGSQLPIDVLPLYSRLSVGEQNKVFKPAHRRKVVLATNVAETSITVPGIAYVIDPGVARISRYSFRSKVQRLPIEAVSQASANQRQGRCGRVANGVCIRLYSEQDFQQRAEFTPAEILRSNLASVILKMLRLGINDITQFDFLDQPDNRLLNDGYNLLQELGGVDNNRKITAIGRQMSDLSVDPKYARIIIQANTLGCLRDVLILISALSIQDPRERPADKQQAADQSHKLLNHNQSDFFSYLQLWQAINNARDELSNAKFKRYCVEQYWSIARVFEWRELFRQLLTQGKSLGWEVDQWVTLTLPEPGGKKAKPDPNFNQRYEKLHRALLSGLLSNIATKDVDGEYIATRSRQIHLFPASAQAKRKPKWIMSAEYLETSRLFAHTIGEIKPDWVIQSANHLCRYSYSSPHYHVRSGSIKAYRKTLLYGLTLRDKEPVNYAPINADESRLIFLQQALLGGAYMPKGKVAEFVAHNESLISDIEKLETKTRRRNLLVNESIIFDFYAERLPSHIVNRHDLEQWLSQGNEQALKLSRDTLLQAELDSEQTSQFPDKMMVHGKEVQIVYKFDPGKRSDGVTMVVPISVLAPFPKHIGDWLVPGLLREKCIALIKTLPKPIRRNFAPAADAVDRVFDMLAPEDVPLHRRLAEQLFRTRGVKVVADDFAIDKLDDFYRMNYRVLDVDGSLVEEGRNLDRLKSSYANLVQTSVHSNNAPERLKLEQHNLERWSFGELAEVVDYQHQGMTVRAFPMLKKQQDESISLLVHDQQSNASYHTHHAVVELAKQVLSSTTQKQTLKYLQKELMSVKQKTRKTGSLGSLATQLKTTSPGAISKPEWTDKLISASLCQACFDGNTLSIRNSEDFTQAITNGAKQWVPIATELEAALLSALRHRDIILNSANTMTVDSIATDLALEDIKAQVYRMFEPSFLSYTSLSALKQYPRYLRAIESRIEKLQFASKTVSEEMVLEELQKDFDLKIDELSHAELELDFVFLSYPSLIEFSKMLLEWRVSIFAQHLKTQMPISEKRLRKFWRAEIVKKN